MEQLLEKLFESVPKVRLLRLFLQNPQDRFTVEQIVNRTQVQPGRTRTELNKLVNLRVVIKRLVSLKDVEEGARPVKNKKKVPSYGLNEALAIKDELHDLFIRASTSSHKRLLSQIKSLGKVKLAVVAGVFLNTERSRTDLLIVGDDIPKRKIERFLALVESDMGKTISYTMMDTDEYKYRRTMFDRFLRDILEYPHEKLINKLS